jgi:hypothetical protein
MIARVLYGFMIFPTSPILGFSGKSPALRVTATTFDNAHAFCHIPVVSFPLTLTDREFHRRNEKAQKQKQLLHSDISVFRCISRAVIPGFDLTRIFFR